MANFKNLSIPRGDDHPINIDIADKNDIAIDITGWTFFLTIKETIDDATDDSNAKVTKTVTNHVDAPNGKTKILLLASDTNELNKEEYFYDIQYKDASGNIITVLFGTMEINRDVTRRTS